MKTVKIILAALGAAAGATVLVGLVKKRNSVYGEEKSEQNPFENKRVRFVEDDNDQVNADGVRGHLEIVSASSSTAGERVEGIEGINGIVEHRKRGFYERYMKRILDIILSGCGLIILSPVFAVIALAVWIDDPGPVLFTQKRVGKNKRFFRLHKFRSMRMNTPHDVPTHTLSNPEKYITRIGRVLRKTSLDELPQIWDIWLGNMSIIGPRPALWNQDKLVALREGASGSSDSSATSAKSGAEGVDSWDVDANSATPGLTGLAQIKGRDELSLEDKAALDKEYVENIGFWMDCKCFFGTIRSVLRHDGVVEGGTGSMSTATSTDEE